ncbi:MAG: hypothetical protein JW803_01145 [Endomicrobiales bacterium]|nr:hypothetical protein [Endomicrobiales bacterium]
MEKKNIDELDVRYAYRKYTKKEVRDFAGNTLNLGYVVFHDTDLGDVTVSNEAGCGGIDAIDTSSARKYITSNLELEKVCGEDGVEVFRVKY